MRIGAGRRATLVGLLAAAAAGVAIGLITYATDAFDRLELDSVDTRFAIRGVEAAPSDIVVVEIDDVTFNELQEFEVRGRERKLRVWGLEEPSGEAS